jgi:hypothetical protein
MSQKAIILLAVGLVIVGGLGFLVYQSKTGKSAIQKPAIDPKNYTYTIDGQTVTLVNGKATQKATSDSATQIVTWYVGNEAVGDFNGDGVADVAIILAQNTGGSGTFYYAIAILSKNSGYTETNAVFFGDRITSQPTQYTDGEIVVNYLDRKIDDPMVAFPTVESSMHLKVIGNQLIKAE